MKYRGRTYSVKRERSDLLGKIPNAVVEMLNAADTDAAVFPPTELYNEGWMLRLVLSAAAGGVSCLPFSFLPGARWFSEALLCSPFSPRRQGDALAEAYAHADGVVGHFRFKPTTKAGLGLVPDSKQFIVIEAKMFSSLAGGIRNASFYDQAARTVACMASIVDRHRKSVSDFESIGFYTVAPDSQIRLGVFAEQMRRESVVETVLRRIEQYEEDRESHTRLQSWFQNALDPLIKRIDLRCWSWENAVEAIVAARPDEGHTIEEFYRRCLKYNQKAQPTSL